MGKRARVEKSDKHEENEVVAEVYRARLFAPFRALGLVCNHVPFHLQTLGNQNFLTVSVGNAFHVYDAERIRLKTASAPMKDPIQALAAFKETTFVACGESVHVFRRGKPSGVLENDASQGCLTQLLVTGDILLGLSDQGTLTAWEHSANEVYSSLQFASNFSATCFMHPDTYLNKILIGSSQGTLQLWNIKTQKLIHEVSSLDSAVTCMVQSPVVDVIAIGLQDGRVLLHNLRLDEHICEFQQKSRITAIAFRSDCEEGIMATADDLGDLAVWDLSGRKLMHHLQGVHQGVVASVAFLPGQPILISSGADNMLKQFLFDSPKSQPQLRVTRAGHAHTPTKVMFYGDDGQCMLTASREQALRALFVEKDSRSQQLSQGAEKAPLPPVTAYDACSATQNRWDNVVSAHEGEAHARVWSFERKILSTRKLPARDNSVVKSVTLSRCGNFAAVGTLSGGIDLYNVQSGTYRRSFTGHAKAVTGLAIDRINRFLTSCSIDGSLKVWDMSTTKEIYSIPFSAPLSRLVYNYDNDLCSVIADDLGIRIVDVENRCIVREFWGHQSRILDAAFDPEGRWLVSSALDATICTWDIAAGALIDKMRVEHTATSLSFSPRGDYLASSHVDKLGVFLWINRSRFTNVDLTPLSEDDADNPPTVPFASFADVANTDALGLDDEVEKSQPGEDVVVSAPTIDQLCEGLMTLSKAAFKSQLLTMIKAREDIGSAKTAHRPSLADGATFESNVDKFSHIHLASRESAESPMEAMGEADGASEVELLERLLKLAPKNLFVELQLLTPDRLPPLLSAVRQHLATARNVEMGEGFLALLLHCQADNLRQLPAGRADMEALLEDHSRRWQAMSAKLALCDSLLTFAES